MPVESTEENTCKEKQLLGCVLLIFESASNFYSDFVEVARTYKEKINLKQIDVEIASTSKRRRAQPGRNCGNVEMANTSKRRITQHGRNCEKKALEERSN
jgi:hypothetical protein